MMDGILIARNLSAIFAWLAFSASAAAAPARVALMREAEPIPVMQRALTRLRAELVAAGFEVTEIERQGDDTREAAEANAAAAGVFATIAIVPRTADAADIWVVDRVTGKTVVRRIQVSTGTGRDVATVLAVRAVELLQASLLEALEPPPPAESTATPAVPPSPSPVVPSDVSAWMEARRPPTEPGPSAGRFALQAGVGVLHSFSGVGPAVLPVLGLAYRFTTDWEVALRAGGPAFAADLRAPGGTIAVRQELLGVEVAYQFLSAAAAVRPMAVGSIGTYHLDVVGAAAPPYKGESNDRFAAFFAIGPGARLRMGERVSLLGDLRLVFIAPQPIVRAAEAKAGSMSRPSLFGEVVVNVVF
jgi:hypothetical protein